MCLTSASTPSLTFSTTMREGGIYNRLYEVSAHPPGILVGGPYVGKWYSHSMGKNMAQGEDMVEDGGHGGG